MPEPVSQRWWPVGLLLAVASLVLGAMWAVSSPVGSSPDDDFHLGSIWCATGDPDRCQLLPKEDPRWGRAMLPAAFAAIECYAEKPKVSGACAADVPDDERAPSRVNDGLYPGGFYEVLAPLARDDIAVSVISMRLTVLASVLGCFALALWAAPALRRSMLLAWFVASIPHGVFLYASTNPSAWAIAGIASLLPATWALFHADRLRAAVLPLCSMGVALAMALAARADAAAYAAVWLVLAVAVWARHRTQLPVVVLCLVLAAVSVWRFAAAGQSAATSGLLTGSSPSTAPGLLWANLIGAPSIWAGSLGGPGYGLGWWDTKLPGGVWVAMLVVVGGLAFLALERMSREKAVLAGTLLAMLWAVPVFILMRSAAVVGSVVQPRYVLPLLMLLLGVLMAPLATRRVTLSGPQRLLAIAATSTAASIALHVQLRRYVTGDQVLGVALTPDADWWWARTWVTPDMVWIIGTLAGTVLAMTVVHLNARSGPGSSADPLEPPAPALARESQDAPASPA